MSKLQELKDRLDRDKDTQAQAQSSGLAIGDELHQLAHELLGMTEGSNRPCLLVLQILLGCFLCGYAQRLLDEDAEGGPTVEQGSSGPSMSPDDLRKLMGT